jgi:hypothetical protein
MGWVADHRGPEAQKRVSRAWAVVWSATRAIVGRTQRDADVLPFPAVTVSGPLAAQMRDDRPQVPAEGLDSSWLVAAVVLTPGLPLRVQLADDNL